MGAAPFARIEYSTSHRRAWKVYHLWAFAEAEPVRAVSPEATRRKLR